MSGYSSNLTLKVKVLPRNLRGVLPLVSATEMGLTTASRAWKPLPPGNVKLNGQPYTTWPSSTTGDVTLSWSHRTRASQGPGTLLVAQDTTGTTSPEGTLTIEVLIAGVVKRTWTGLTGTSQVYPLPQRRHRKDPECPHMSAPPRPHSSVRSARRAYGDTGSISRGSV